VEATDGKIGRVEDFLIDDKTWAIQQLIVGTRKWPASAGGHVLVSPQHVDAVSWPNTTVSVDMTRAAVTAAPPYQPAIHRSLFAE
jgi:hypothetical protein